MNNKTEVPVELIRELPDMRASIRLCIAYSGKPLKTVAYELDIKPDHLSKMINPSEDPRHFPPNKLGDLMDVCGNDVPLLFLLLSRGYDMPRTVGALADENSLLKSRVLQLEEQRNQALNIFKTIEIR